MAAPMRIGSLCAVAGSILIGVAGCGGSSSETPPPLEPDPEGFNYAGGRAPRQRDFVQAEPQDEEDDDEVRPKRAKPSKPARPNGKAPSTWGYNGESEPGPKLK